MEATAEARTYNGWTNYETWAVKLWMDNDEGEYREYQRLARRAGSIYELMTTIKDAHEEAAPDLGGSVFGDLLSAAMSEVNWYEIAESLYNDAREDEDEDEES